MSAETLPAHLQRYVVDQDYSRYTPVDHAVWRLIMRRLTSFLKDHAHPCYMDGLAKTGISVEEIPSIEHMSEQLERFGWRALPVSGFIPPAAFMEMQALSILPIASDLRTLEHLEYTPAPDIVHEAAGHAPILVDPEFANYLKNYAQVARRAIISREDLDQYEAIRVLSDLKEDPSSRPEQIQKAEARLSKISAGMSHLSEAALLGRMNWWTAEYGLIGDLQAPRIFGAGLLSSVGESRSCLEPAVKKIPLSLACIDYAYDITERQPQLFVVQRFEDLSVVLEQLANRMAFRVGGLESLRKARAAQSVNTVVLDTGIEISGQLQDFTEADGHPVYLKFTGPVQLCENSSELEGQGRAQHPQGFGTPVGLPREDLRTLRVGDVTELTWPHGVRLKGKLRGVRRSQRGEIFLLSFDHCTVQRGEELLFDPEWGSFDMAVGAKVAAVYGGPADRRAYGETEDFARKLVPRRLYSATELERHRLYKEVRTLRAQRHLESARLLDILNKIRALDPRDWLLNVEVREVAAGWNFRDVLEVADRRLEEQMRSESVGHLIRDALQTPSTYRQRLHT